MLTQAKSIESLHVRLRRLMDELSLIRAAFLMKVHPYCPIDNACVICHGTPDQPSFHRFHDWSGMTTQTPTTNESAGTLSDARQKLTYTKVL